IPYVKHAKTAVMDMFRGMRAKGREGRIKGIESLVNEAMADPDLAAKLLSQTQMEPGGMMGVLGYQAGMQAPQLERQTGEPKQKRPLRQAGGGVPSIGGTGGRPPGARETAR